MRSFARSKQRRWSVVVLAAVSGLTFLTMTSRFAAPSLPSTAQGGGSPTPTFEQTSTPAFPRPIYGEAEAIARSQELFPEGHNPHDIVARLITHRTLETWLHGPEYWSNPSGNPEQGEWQAPEFHPDHPAWLVGILGDNLTDVNVMSIAIPAPFLSSTASLVPGAFYAWDANSGLNAGFGTLLTTSEQNHGSIELMPTEQVTIVPATDQPAIGEPTPTP